MRDVGVGILCGRGTRDVAAALAVLTISVLVLGGCALPVEGAGETDELAEAPVGFVEQALSGPAPITGCTPGDEQTLRRAIDHARHRLGQQQSEWSYQSYFGSNPLIRESADDIVLRIRDHISGYNIGSSAEAAAETYPGNNFTFSCAVRNCGPRNAWIRPGSWHINICPSFFTGLEFQGRGRSRTQIGTIVHEAAHRMIGGDEHYAENELDAIRLAESSPYYAMVNPDSYAYFIQE